MNARASLHCESFASHERTAAPARWPRGSTDVRFPIPTLLTHMDGARMSSLVRTRSLALPADPVTFKSELVKAGIEPSNTFSTLTETLTQGRKQRQQSVTEKKRAVKKRRRGAELRTNAHLKDDERFRDDFSLQKM